MKDMDEGRFELYDLLKVKLDEEPARRLVAALRPDPDELVTKTFLDARIADQTDRLTWRMITIMGAWTAIGTSLFALLSKLVH